MAMETREELPSGGWVEMRDPMFLRTKDRDQLIRQVQSADRKELSEIDQGLLGGKELAALLITAWHLPYQPDDNEDGTPRSWTLPKNDVTILDELYVSDWAVVEEHLKVASKIINGGKASPDQHEDPASPSGPESA